MLFLERCGFLGFYGGEAARHKVLKLEFTNHALSGLII
jgi:hypothetical protein